MDGCLGTFHTEILAIMGARTLSLCKFFAYPQVLQGEETHFQKEVFSGHGEHFLDKILPGEIEGHICFLYSERQSS